MVRVNISEMRAGINTIVLTVFTWMWHILACQTSPPNPIIFVMPEPAIPTLFVYRRVSDFDL